MDEKVSPQAVFGREIASHVREIAHLRRVLREETQGVPETDRGLRTDLRLERHLHGARRRLRGRHRRPLEGAASAGQREEKGDEVFA